MELQVGVKAFLQNQEGKYLILKISKERYPERKEKWDIPGGRIEPEKSLMENLRREIKEETGLLLEDQVRLIAAQDILRVPGRHVVRLTYRGKVKGEVKLSEEHTSYKWVTMNELRRLQKVDVYARRLIHSELL